MKIGIISDTHNDVEMVRKAVAVFRERKVDLVVHAGDLTSPKIIELFEGLPCRFVLGNCDLDAEAISAKADTLGFGCVENCCDFVLGGKRILLFHGNDIPLFRSAVASGKYDYIIKGHTHTYENYMSNKTRVINPGSIYREEERTVSILDVGTDRVEKIKIDAD
jgi:putative phosphoesterase